VAERCQVAISPSLFYHKLMFDFALSSVFLAFSFEVSFSTQKSHSRGHSRPMYPFLGLGLVLVSPFPCINPSPFHHKFLATVEVVHVVERCLIAINPSLFNNHQLIFDFAFCSVFFLFSAFFASCSVCSLVRGRIGFLFYVCKIRTTMAQKYFVVANI
jgi:hypothetical protein